MVMVMPQYYAIFKKYIVLSLSEGRYRKTVTELFIE